VFAYDVDPAISRGFALEISEHFSLEVVPVDTPEEAVKGCDMVVTAGPILKKPHATIQAGWWGEGAFASLVDFDSYWHPAALKEADKFCTDDLAQLQHYRDAGYFQDIPPIHADLGELVSGKKVGRETAAERTIACNLGLAMDDMAVAPAIYRRAMELGLGTKLPL
jgi:ornithine cyclodeaminase/alanine dehydrogenase-like protein (mu-crystallin family)